MRAILPAGGRAERFGGVMKELLPIGEGQTLLSAAIARARALGATSVAVVTSAEKAAIHERVLAGQGVDLIVASNCGLWGALRAALRPEPGMLILPDTVWATTATIPRAPLAFGVFETDEAWRYSVFQDGRIITKPAGASRGLAWGCVAWSIDTAAWWLRNGADDYDAAFNDAIPYFGCATFPITGYHDLGTWAAYRRYLEGL